MSKDDSMTEKKKQTKLTYDFKYVLDCEDLRGVLEPLGVKVEEDPKYRGSDTVGLIFTANFESIFDAAELVGKEDMRMKTVDWLRSFPEESMKKMCEKMEPKQLFETLAGLLENP